MSSAKQLWHTRLHPRHRFHPIPPWSAEAATVTLLPSELEQIDCSAVRSEL